MNKQTIRFIFLAIIVFIASTLASQYFSYEKKQNHKNQAIAEHSATLDQTNHGKGNSPNKSHDIPNVVSHHTNSSFPKVINHDVDPAMITVVTDVLNVKINSHGDLIVAELKKYPQDPKNAAKGFILLNNNDDTRVYVAQSGLISEQGPDSTTQGRATFTSNQSHYELKKQDKDLYVDLIYNTRLDDSEQQINFTKRFIFHRNSYVITVEYIIDNKSNEVYKGSMYGRLKRRPDKTSSGFLGSGLKTYTGAAINTPDVKYKKISFSDMKTPYKATVTGGGWIAMLEHYFVSAWIPNSSLLSEYQTETFSDGSFGIRFVNSAINVAPQETKTISAQIFLGPKIASTLKNVAPALDLTVDYGVLWWLCVPLFLLLKGIFDIIGNWGWAIICTTLLIKLVFYKLSASSYRSMGNLRQLQPRIEALKERYGEDRQKFSQAIMDLYRQEKVNPLGGCLPILVQIPVFISLYYVLLESVDLRQAHWCLWIMDLSAKDPFYILPIIMGISMLVQQKMNPPPPDPIQAKVLTIMPIFFTVLFLQFPSGLMLYWVVNNILSILQQAFITKNYVAKKR